MREIKFRAWDPVGKTMSQSFGIHESISFRRYDFNIPYFSSIADFIVMQYTGLKDKNGKEIYEGDIVALIGAPYCFDENPIAEVGFMENIAAFRLIKPDRWLGNGWEKAVEVIGNIYENPELVDNKAKV